MSPPSGLRAREAKSSKKSSTISKPSTAAAAPIDHVQKSKARPQSLRASNGHGKSSLSAPSFAPPISINLNASSYDRSDPFSAFNILLKLLGSLASRTGILQYKLTAAEHKLSLHLLSIIEPFLGTELSLLLPPCSTTKSDSKKGGDSTTASSAFQHQPIRRRTLTRQPTEILDTIVSHIEEPRELLALAQTCHRFYDIVVPRHIHYRVIRCKLSTISVWHHLSTHKSLAKNVRKLEIIDERAVVQGNGIRGTGRDAGMTRRLRIPPGIQRTDTDLEAATTTATSQSSSSSSDDEDDPERRPPLAGIHGKRERNLVRALSHMSGLQNFTWSCNHSPVSADDLLSALAKCRDLQGVEIADNLIFSAPAGAAVVATAHDANAEEGDENTTANSAVVLRNMHQIRIKSTHHTYGSTRTPSIVRISNMLNYCPNLQILDLSYTPPRTPPNGAAGGGLLMHMLNPNPGLSRPCADHLLNFNRWPDSLTTLILTNVRCQLVTSTAEIEPAHDIISPNAGAASGLVIGMDSLATFLAAHPYIEVLHLDVVASAPPLAAPPLTATTTAPGPDNNAQLPTNNAQGHLLPPAPPSANSALAVTGVQNTTATAAPAPAPAPTTTTVLLTLPPSALPRLRELKTSRELAICILSTPFFPTLPPLESIIGVRFSGANQYASTAAAAAAAPSSRSAVTAPSSTTNTSTNTAAAAMRTIGAADQRFLRALRQFASTMVNVEMIGWNEMDDVKRLVECLPRIRRLDIGRKLGGVDHHHRDSSPSRHHHHLGAGGNGAAGAAASASSSLPPPITNPVEWANILKELPELEEVKGLRFFYPVPLSTASTSHHRYNQHTRYTTAPSAPAVKSALPTELNQITRITHLPAPASTLSTTDQSRLKKNDEIASMLVWKCPSLKRVDFWEGPNANAGAGASVGAGANAGMAGVSSIGCASAGAGAGAGVGARTVVVLGSSTSSVVSAASGLTAGPVVSVAAMGATSTGPGPGAVGVTVDAEQQSDEVVHSRNANGAGKVKWAIGKTWIA